jgi:hypothetical protein
VEIDVSTESWSEERKRLLRLLKGIDAGEITYIDEDNDRQLQATNKENIAALRARLGKLNARLGAND